MTAPMTSPIPSNPRILSRSEHPISRKAIDTDVLRSMYRLRHEGYDVYLVGGAVRDFMRGVEPKDFDLATNATPMELRRIFRASRIIGRRFRIVHLYFPGGKRIEVSTLRRQADSQDTGETIEDDNCWGTVETDSFRRDFTINALFYDLGDFSILDYTGGIEDLKQGVIRTVGDPMARFVEDPVRMLRAIKFAARFGYRFDPATEAALRELPAKILDASRARVTEEIFRILQQANRHQGMEMLGRYGFLDHLFPTWMKAVGLEGLEQVIEFYDTVEKEARAGHHLPLEVLAAGLFLPMLDTVDPANGNFQDHAMTLTDEVRKIGHEMDLPRRLVHVIVTLLRGQLYLLYHAGRHKSVTRFVQSREFDWVWRLHDLAFGHIEPLHHIQERWLAARESLPTALGGWSHVADLRDLYSFRGKDGGGRIDEGDVQTILDTPHRIHETEPRYPHRL